MEQFDLHSSELGVDIQTSVGPGDLVTHLTQSLLFHSVHFDTAVLM